MPPGHFIFPPRKKMSKTNAANRANSTIIHTTGTVPFIDFERKHSKIDEDGKCVWPSASELWMLEHTKKGDDGQLVFVDPRSAEIHEETFTTETQQSGCGSSVTVYPMDVLLSQHHNRRVGKGHGFAPLRTPPTRKKAACHTVASHNERQLVDVIERLQRDLENRDTLLQKLQSRQDKFAKLATKMGYDVDNISDDDDQAPSGGGLGAQSGGVEVNQQQQN